MLQLLTVTILEAIAALPASARAWLAAQLKRARRRRHEQPSSDQGA